MIPRWIDRSQFPFVVHTYDHADGRLAYVDEGAGRTLLFLHGNPSWSFLYRHVIANLRSDFRCIALDHLGFGLSDKPDRGDYSPESHARRLGDFIDHLGIGQVTLVAHDFGGPIGTSWALQNPERTDALILFNTWMWSLRRNPEAMALFKNFDNPINRFYYTQLRASPKFFLPVLVADAHEMPKPVLEQYLLPFSEHRSRSGPYAMARHLIRSSDWLDSLWDRKDRIEHLPMLLLWGVNDKISGAEGLVRLEHGFPNSRSVCLEKAGNFVPQDAAKRAVTEIRGFMRTVGAPVFWPGFLD